MEVVSEEGRFFIPFDASVFEVVQLVIRGGYVVEELTGSTRAAHKRGMGHLLHE
jgi:hypothetical protein